MKHAKHAKHAKKEEAQPKEKKKLLKFPSRAQLSHGETAQGKDRPERQAQAPKSGRFSKKDHAQGKEPERGAARPRAVVVYEDTAEEAAAKKLAFKKMPKAVYRLGLILVLLIIALAVWVNRDNLKPDQIGSWLQQQFTGTGVGDGYPVQTLGNQVDAANFGHIGSDVYLLSDTALTVLSPSGKDIVSLRHSYDNPAGCIQKNNYLVYNLGGTGYFVQYGTDKNTQLEADNDLLAGAICTGGSYAVAFKGSAYASELEVYLKNGTLQYHYGFTSGYISAVALQSSGKAGAVTSVDTEKGILYSKVTMLDFSQELAVAEYRCDGNMLYDLFYDDSGRFYAIGDEGVAIGSAAGGGVQEYSFDGREVTAYGYDDGRLFVAVSSFEHAGPGTILVYDGINSPVVMEIAARVESVSAYAGALCALYGGDVVFYDIVTGVETARGEAGTDARAVTLGNESTAYVLGMNQVRAVKAE